jgi:hypothetical protein
MIQASQIREHMKVMGSDGQQLSSVERLDGTSRIKLARSGTAGGQEHFIPLDWVASVEGQTLRLSKSSHDVREQFERSGTAQKR